MIIKQKDIVLLPYPFTDLEGNKVRPALVVSHDYFNNLSADIIAIPLTSVLKDVPYSVFITQNDMASGKLLVPSRIRADKIFTVEKKIVSFKIGALKDASFKKVKKELNALF